jgi:hypothetical protein
VSKLIPAKLYGRLLLALTMTILAGALLFAGCPTYEQCVARCGGNAACLRFCNSTGCPPALVASACPAYDQCVAACNGDPRCLPRCRAIDCPPPAPPC